MPAYEDLAGLYDLLMDDVDYDAWADYYLRLLASEGVAPKRLCDCACGTGSLSTRFAARGIRVIGADLSGEMLERAQQNARLKGVQVMFVRQDMRALTLGRPVDAIVCGCDGVNYLLDDGALNDFFVAAHRALRPGGALAFDISSAYKLEKVLGNGFFGEERDEAAYLWSNAFDDQRRRLTMDLTFFVRDDDGRYRRFTECHVQQAHEADHLVERLKGNGFARVRVFGGQTFEPPGPLEQRIHFLAVRE